MITDYSVDEIARLLNMQPHPEGGYFRETYRSSLVLPGEALMPHFPAARSASTAIYFLLGDGAFSGFHRIRSDEVWHFYAGSPLQIHQVDPNGTYRLINLGFDLAKGIEPQAMVPAGSWFASESVSEKGWSLVGCTVAPGFDFADFELAEKDKLTASFPQHAAIFSRLCRQ